MRGNKVVTLASPPHLPPPSKVENDIESSSEQESLKSTSGSAEEVDLPPIDVQYPLLDIILAQVPIVERWGYPDMLASYNNGLIKLSNGRTKKSLYLERILTTIGMMELPIFGA